MIRRNIRPILAFFLVCVIGGLISYLANNSCDAILNYTWTMQLGLGTMIWALLKTTFIFTSGLTLFSLIKKKIPKGAYEKAKLYYFAVLPLFVFHSQFLSIPKLLANRSIKQSICDKSATNGMQTESTNINLTEYRFLKNKLFLLPALPQSSDSINISYYTDDFLGDFILKIKFRCDTNEPIDTINKLWTTTNIDKLANKKTVRYYGQSR